MFHKREASRGFTVIELILAMAFFSFILVFIVTTITQILGTYNKGLTVKAINQSGRSIAGEIQRSLRDTSPELVNLSRVGQGRLCTGSYSYVWSNNNTATVPSTTITNRYSDGTEVLFARIYDRGNQICNSVGSILPATIGTPPVNVKGGATELLSDRLRVRSLQISQSAAPNEGMYTVRFVVTSDDPAAIRAIPANQGSLTDSDFVCAVTDRITDQFCAANLFVTYAYAKN